MWQKVHNEWNICSDYGQVQWGAVMTCWILGYAILMVHNCKKSKRHRMVRIK
jgi:hypothetical protein